MKLPNYLTVIASNFPNLFIEGIDNILDNINKRLTIAELSRKINMKDSTVRAVFDHRSRCSLDILSKVFQATGLNVWNQVFEKSTFLDGQNHKKHIRIPKILTEDLAYLMGAFRDGSISYPDKVSVSQKNKQWLQEIQKIIENNFGLKTKIFGPREKDGCYYLKITSVALYALIKTLFNIEKGSWKTPKIILKSPKNFQKFYIKGFWEAEGSFKSNGSPVIYQTWITPNKCPPLEDIIEMLHKFGIESNLLGPYKSKNRHSFEVYVRSKYKQDFLRLMNSNFKMFTST